MVERFIQHIRTKKLLDSDKKYLLAISGGIDSVCLGYLLQVAGIDFGLATVNYQLRGEESQGDEDFVRTMAEKWQVPLHVKRLEPYEMEQEGRSIQMWARDIRYAWFEDLLREYGYAGVVVAHQFEDQMETIFLNLLRGTGIEGLYGMADQRGHVIRPLLPFKREEILQFMQEQGYPWREDSSNMKNLYKRNYLRNEIFPLLEKRFPEALSVMDQSFKRLKDTGRAFFHLYEQWKEVNVQKEGPYQYLALFSLNHVPGRVSLLYYWLRDYGFTTQEVEDVAVAIDNGMPGKTFFGNGYMLNLDREYLILGKLEEDLGPVMLERGDIGLRIAGLDYDLLYLAEDFSLDRSSENAMLDLDKLEFPLTFRNWEQGDKFVPLGMQQEKKISDLLIDLKVPLIAKRKVKVLCSGGKIAWVVGYRISELFKCSPQTTQVMYFKKRKP